MRSDRSPEETNAAYQEALTRAGWRPWRVAECSPEGQEGHESCWQRDEYVLDLWVYQPECQVQLKSPGASTGPTAQPQAEAVCPPTVVTLKVINRAAIRAADPPA